MQTDDNTFIVDSDSALAECIRWLTWRLSFHPYQVVSIRDGLTRTLEQNALLWPLLTDIAQQVVWHGKKYKKDDWKIILTGSFLKCEFVPNVDGTGFVVLGMSTSHMSRKVFSDLIEFIFHFGASQDVEWSEKSEKVSEKARAEK